jgi:hypothetical protein
MKKLIALSLITVGLTVSYSAYGLIIDAFDDPSVSGAHTKIQAPPSTDPSSQTVYGFNIIQWARTAEVGVLSGVGTVQAENVEGGGGYMYFSAPQFTGGFLHLTYNAGGLGLGGVDLTDSGGASGLQMWMAGEHTASSYFIVTDNNSTSLVYEPNPVGANTYYLPFTDFAGIDFTQIYSIEYYLIGSTSAGDYAIDFIKSSPPPGLPDTGGTLALLSVAVGLLAFARSKRNA